MSDVAFQVHEAVPYGGPDAPELRATIYQPIAQGPSPTLLSVRGGGWHLNDRFSTRVLDEAFAAAGILVAAIDFRVPTSPRFRERTRASTARSAGSRPVPRISAGRPTSARSACRAGGSRS